MSHTPGPWRAVKAPHGVIDIFDSRDRDIVTVFGGGVEAESKEANARLIAAAPDLLEAAKNLRAAQRAYMERRGSETLGMAVGEAANHLDAAIAKAEGGS